MRNLILGATGLIGSHLLAGLAERAAPALGTWYQTPHPDHAPLDVRDADAVAALLDDYQPDATFFCAGASDPRTAELDPETTRSVIAGGARTVAEAVARSGGVMVLFSADAVLGNAKGARREDAEPAPTGVWAEALAGAEAAVREVLPESHLIVRTSWVFGGPAFDRGPAGRLVAAAAAGEPVRAALDVYGQPTDAADLAEAALELVKAGERGTVHVVGPDRHTEFSFARLALHLWGRDAELAEADARGAARWGAPARPWLDRGKLRGLLGAKAVRPPAEALRRSRGAAWERADGMVALRAA